MLEMVKRALRISHTQFDEEILETIEAARNDMERAGMSPTATRDETNPLVSQAVRFYCQWIYANDQKLKDGYLAAYEKLVDNMRKSTEYREG